MGKPCFFVFCGSHFSHFQPGSAKGLDFMGDWGRKQWQGAGTYQCCLRDHRSCILHKTEQWHGFGSQIQKKLCLLIIAHSNQHFLSASEPATCNVKWWPIKSFRDICKNVSGKYNLKMLPLCLPLGSQDTPTSVDTCPICFQDSFCMLVVAKCRDKDNGKELTEEGRQANPLQRYGFVWGRREEAAPHTAKAAGRTLPWGHGEAGGCYGSGEEGKLNI